ncbi:ABC transporter substrate-binding protein [soil metagenome]
MKFKHQIIIFSLFLLAFTLLTACPQRPKDTITMSLSEKFSGLDTLSSGSTDAAADRIRTLMYNSLVKKNENFEYVGDLAKNIKVGDDGQTITFILQENVKFHNGKVFTSADAKYTLEALFQAEKSAKAGSFFDSVPDQNAPGGKRKVAHIEKIETPDANTLVITVIRPALVNQLLSNLVTIPMIPEGTIEQQKSSPIGTGAFKFVSFDQVNSNVEFEAFPECWEGAPKIQKLRVKTVTDSNALQAELQSGNVDLAPIPNNLSPDSINNLGQLPNLKVEKFEGSNIDYIGFNTEAAPLNNLKIRQAIAYAINREQIIQTILQGQAKLAHSIIPAESWAYSEGTKYEYNPTKAKQLLQEAGYKGEVIKFKYAANNTAISLYGQVIENSLKEIGINVETETLIPDVLRETLKNGQFQMNTGRWIGGNQDPIFYKDLFASTEFPDKKESGRNRSRYNNAEFDKSVNDAIDLTSTDKAKAKELYIKVQSIISNDLPLFPLWYPSNIVISSKRVSNVKINASGDWSFVKNVTVNN